jgi:murein DD-endopeptidase MepM/ murein hydrolase activator NlpD
VSFNAASQVYKYKDDKGNWVYSDKQPVNDLSYEKIKYNTSKKKKLHPKVYTIKGVDNESNNNFLMVNNPLFSPVEIGFTSIINQKIIHKVIPPRSNEKLLESKENIVKVSYRWLLGEPEIDVDDYAYQPPFLTKAGHKITQGFNGRFSHQGEYSRYAVDIAMAVGTNIHAVRSGMVVWVKDDYHMSGRTQYFLDKANVIKVMHDDGTFALYAHILMDTAVVKVGDRVTSGQLLARSGSSGFSTGPHLHFMIFRNVGFKVVSIPFNFIDKNGVEFKPKRGMKLLATR